MSRLSKILILISTTFNICFHLMHVCLKKLRFSYYLVRQSKYFTNSNRNIMNNSREITQSNLPSSFQQFYKNAQLFIDSSTLRGLKDSTQDEKILETLTKAQLSHYDFLQIQIFELNKDIKSKFGSITLHDKKSILIQAKNISDELERFCASLKATLIFNLFQKFIACLTMVSSMNYCSTVDSKSQTHSLNNNILKEQSNKKALVSGKLSNYNQQPQIQRKELMRNRLAGVSLYNETYIRHLDNRTSLINAAQIIAQHNLKDEFWAQLKRDYNQTIGIGINEPKIDEKQANLQELNTATKILNHHSIEKDKQIKKLFQQAKVSTIHENQENSASLVYQSDVFGQDIFYLDGSPDPAQKIFEDIILIYKDEKLSTLKSVRKLFSRFCEYSKQKNQNFIQKLRQQRLKIKQLEQKLDVKLNRRQISTQTAIDKQTEVLTKQVNHLKIQNNKLQFFTQNMQEVLRKQTLQINKSEKTKMQISARLEANFKKCNELQKTIKSKLGTSTMTNKKQCTDIAGAQIASAIKNNDSGHLQQNEINQKNDAKNSIFQADNNGFDKFYHTDKVRQVEKNLRKYRVDFRLQNSSPTQEAKTKVYNISLSKSEKVINQSDLTTQQRTKRRRKIMKHVFNNRNGIYDSVRQISANSSFISSLQKKQSIQQACLQQNQLTICSKQCAYSFVGTAHQAKSLINQCLQFSLKSGNQFERSQSLLKKGNKLKLIDEQQQDSNKVNSNDSWNKKSDKQNNVTIFVAKNNQNTASLTNRQQSNSLSKLKRKLKKISNTSTLNGKNQQYQQSYMGKDQYSKTIQPTLFYLKQNEKQQPVKGGQNTCNSNWKTNSFDFDYKYQFSPFYELNRVFHETSKIEQRKRRIQTKSNNRKVLNTKKLVMSLHNNVIDKMTM